MLEEKNNNYILENAYDSASEFIFRGDLEMVLQSPSGLRTVFVLVEGKFDKPVYERRMFVKRKSIVKIAAALDRKGEPKGGKQHVLNIVDYFTKQQKPNVIGIIDRDYDYYSDPATTRPENIFETDYRDLEMTLLQDSVVTSTLLSDGLYAAKYNECIDKCRELGYIRVAAAMCGFESRVGNWKLSTIWNHGCEIPNWSQNVMSYTVKKATQRGISFSATIVDTYKNQLNLVNESIYNICRGHDVIGLWSHMIQHQATHSPDDLCAIMRDACPVETIRSWKLYRDIQSWEQMAGYKILI